MKQYSTYKDSGIEWIGKIPSDWELWKLKHTVNLINEKEDYNGQEYVGLENVESGSGKYIKTNKRVVEGISNKFITDDVLFGKLRPYLAKCIIAEFSGICSSEFLVLRNFIGVTSYLQYVLLSEKVVDIVNSSTYGAKMPRASWDFIGQLKIPMPGIEEQQNIVKHLNNKTAAIEKVIYEKEKLIKLLREKRQIVINQAVTKGLDSEVTMKDSKIEWVGKIPESWDITKIKYNTYVKGRIGWQGLKSDEFIDEGAYLVTGTDLIDGTISWDSCYHIGNERYNEAPEIQLRNGDLLITKDGTIGKVAIVKDMPDRAILNSGLFVTRPINNAYLTKYMYWILNSNVFWRYFRYFETGSTIKHLYQETFVNFSFPLPSLDEQERISDFLDSKTSVIDNVITDIIIQIDKLKEYRQSIISEAVTGKVVV